MYKLLLSGHVGMCPSIALAVLIGLILLFLTVLRVWKLNTYSCVNLLQDLLNKTMNDNVNNVSLMNESIAMVIAKVR